MPLYEYQCASCGKTLEVIQKFSDAPLQQCTECGGRLERLLSAPAIQFKGNGWYITDYARKKSGGKLEKDSSAKKESSTSSGAGETSTSDSKKDGSTDKS